MESLAWALLLLLLLLSSANTDVLLSGLLSTLDTCGLVVEDGSSGFTDAVVVLGSLLVLAVSLLDCGGKAVEDESMSSDL